MQWEQVMLTVKALSPDKTDIGRGRWCLGASRQQSFVRKRRVQGIAPGS
jgi:hypothetical protein